MKLLGVILASAVAQDLRQQKRKTLKKQKLEKEDRTVRYEYMEQPPTEQCLFTGKNAYTGQEDFGQELTGNQYNLSYQASGLNGYIDIQDYHDFMNCYIDIVADPTCEEIEINFSSAWVETCGGHDSGYACACDRFWISDENNRYPNQCGCTGDDCIREFLYYGDDYISDDTNDDDYEWNDDSQQVHGNTFRFNMQTDESVYGGDIRVDWRCVSQRTTTTTTTTRSTTTRSTTTRRTTTSTTTLTTQPETTNSCSSHHGSHIEFRAHIYSALSAAVDNESDLSSKRARQFRGWLTSSFNLYHQAVSRNRRCFRNKFTSDSPGDLSSEILGSDCGLDIALGDINNACSKLRSYFTWAYEDCNGNGNAGGNNNKLHGVLGRLEHRCNRINEIREEIANRN